MKTQNTLNWRVAALINGFKDATAYRVEFFLEFIGYAIVPALTQWILWYCIFKMGGAETLAGKDYQEFLTYTFVSMLFSQIRGGNHDFELAELIREGSLSQYLLRPVSVLEFVYIRGVAPKLLITFIGFIFGIGMSIYLGYSFANLLLAFGMALIGNVIHYQVGAIIASAAFYWEEAYSLLMVKNMIVGILSGEVIPLYLFPEALSWIWKFTPFYLYVYGPTQIMMGQWDAFEITKNFGIAALWIFGLSLLTKAAWARGIYKYQSLGG